LKFGEYRGLSTAVAGQAIPIAGLSLLSCDKQDAVLEVAEAEQQVQALERPHDKVTVLNDKGEVLETYTFAAQTADESESLIETRHGGGGGTVITGDFVERSPNNDGGYNYTCMANPDAICYDNTK
jgi:hypothetical protein